MDWEFVRSTMVLLAINLGYAVVALVVGVVTVIALDRWLFRPR